MCSSVRRFKSCLCAQVCIGLNLVCVQFSPVQVINGVMSLALCLQVVSQAPQHFRSSEKQATCVGCFACQCICSVISLHSSTPKAVRPQEFSKRMLTTTHADDNFKYNFFLCCFTSIDTTYGYQGQGDRVPVSSSSLCSNT